MQITKHAFLFVFDRVTGEAVWPIEERPVPASTTPVMVDNSGDLDVLVRIDPADDDDGGGRSRRPHPFTRGLGCA